MYLSVRLVAFTTKSSPPYEEDAEENKSYVEWPSGPKHMRTYTNLHEESTVELLKKDLKSLTDIYACKYNNNSKIFLGSSIDLSIRTVEHLKNRSSIYLKILRNMV